MTAYYNELDPYAAQWLRNLVSAANITAGHVDERSIADVRADDLVGYRRCHFFAGIGVWDYALRLAGWPDDAPVWTGSCPCQPFSTAGKRKGFNDERHLWHEWFRLISQCRPPVVFGEQVASPDGYAWLDVVQTDLETAGYAVGSIVLPAAGFGAPHARHRIFFVADASYERRDREHALLQQARGWNECDLPEIAWGGAACSMANTDEPRLQRWIGEGMRQCARERIAGEDSASCRPGPTNGFWRDADWLFCRDGKWRPVEPGTSPLAHGISARVGRLRAYGNAIVAPVAAEFVSAYLSYKHERDMRGIRNGL